MRDQVNRIALDFVTQQHYPRWYSKTISFWHDELAIRRRHDAPVPAPDRRRHPHVYWWYSDRKSCPMELARLKGAVGFVLLWLVGVSCAQAAATTGQPSRVALVIGNGSY